MVTMSSKQLRCVAGATAIVVMTTFASTAAARAGTIRGRDLAVHLQIESLGAPAHILVGASGAAPRFSVLVTTRNNGNTAAGPSKTALTLKSGSFTRVYQWNVRKLAHNEVSRHFVTVENFEPDLGFAQLTAEADYHHVVSDVNRRNNEAKDKIAVEPREWDVANWSSEDTGPSSYNITQTSDGFYLRFQKYEDGFVYQAYGPVKDTPKKYPGCSSISGSKTITQTPWADSSLKIAADLKTYTASVPTSTNNFFATCSFVTAAFQIQVGFIDLQTGGVARHKDPDDTELAGTDSRANPIGQTSWAWTFKAHLPKR